MNAKINESAAKSILLAALNSECEITNDVSLKIERVLKGTHKTYKYVLITGLLAKATNKHVNPIALQAGAPIQGAYDARSLCHKVVVPFERDILNNALGGSNEPFLNKPARFTHLEISNAVRRGNDKETLIAVIDIFKSLNNSEEAKAYLNCAIQYLIKVSEQVKLFSNITLKHNPTLTEIYTFTTQFLEKSFEGETCAILIGTLLRIYYNSISDEFIVKPHKVNQSGASSNEIADIDVYRNEEFQFGIEVKDKSFSIYDLAHAFTKILQSGGKKAGFIYGRNATFDKEEIHRKLQSYAKSGMYTFVIDIYTFTRTMLFLVDIQDKKTFAETILEIAVEINCKNTTKEWIQELYLQLNWKQP